MTIEEAAREGALAMKARIIEALRDSHARDTGYDEHGPDEGCAQCAVWYRALAAVEAVEP